MINILSEGGGIFGNGPAIPFAIMAALVVMMYMQSRSHKKEKAAFKVWVDQLKKGTRIVTKSGIYGVITSVRDDSIVIKIDEDKGIKMTITKDSVSHGVNEADNNENKKS